MVVRALLAALLTQVVLTFLSAAFVLPRTFRTLADFVEVTGPETAGTLTYGAPLPVGELTCERWAWLAAFRPEVGAGPRYLECLGGQLTFGALPLVANVLLTATLLSLTAARARGWSSLLAIPTIVVLSLSLPVPDPTVPTALQAGTRWWLGVWAASIVITGAIVYGWHRLHAFSSHRPRS